MDPVCLLKRNIERDEIPGNIQLNQFFVKRQEKVIT